MAPVPKDVRAFELTSLARYLAEELPRHDRFRERFGTPDIEALTVDAFPGGYSNLTFLVRLGTTELVLRRPPIGPVPARAHDMAREYRWLAALHPVYPLAPEPFLLCEDPSVIGSVFYVMERRLGLVIRDEEPEILRHDPALRRRVGEALVDTLASLHELDVSSPPLAALGKPRGFVARQIEGWTERWIRARTDEVPEMEALATWLRQHSPAEAGSSVPSVVHGDFKLDNVVLDERDPSKVVGVLDWEMVALGDPLVDVGMLLVYWVHAAMAGARDSWATVTGRAGWLGRDAVLERYEAKSGRNLANIRFYERFALFKLAVILQQIYLRRLRGQTDDPRFAHLGERVLTLARYAAGLSP